MPKDTKTLCIKKGCASVLTQPHGVTIVYYCLVHSFAVFRNLMMEENNKLKNITMTIMLFL